MTLDQLLTLLGGVSTTTLYLGLFVYLFLETRKETANREKQAREDQAKRDEQARADRATEQAKAEERENWFRQTIEKFQVVEASTSDIQRRVLEKLDAMDKRVERIESILSREGRKT